jgi:hypothetical protein
VRVTEMSQGEEYKEHFTRSPRPNFYNSKEMGKYFKKKKKR